MGSWNYNWSAASQIIGTTDGYITMSGTTEQYSSDIDFATDGELGAHVMVEVNFDSTPTDHLDVKLYGSLDGTNYDDTPLNQFRIDKATDPNQVSFVLNGDMAHYRVGVVQSGSTDTHDVRAYLKSFSGENA